MIEFGQDKRPDEIFNLDNRIEVINFTPSSPLSPYIEWNRPPEPSWVHTHAGAEVGIVLKGSQERWFDDYYVITSPGDVWVCAPWESHGWKDISPKLTQVSFHFTPEFLSEERLDGHSWFSILAVPQEVRPRVATNNLRKKTLSIGWDLIKEAREQLPSWQDIVRLGLLRLLLELTRGWTPDAQMEKHESFLRESFSHVMEALRLAEEKFPEHVHVLEAAHVCGMGRVMFNRVFKNAIGISFGKYQLYHRLRHARRLLQTTDLSIKTIAQDTGFTDTSHLVHTFSKQYKYTPSQYRDMQRS